MSKLLLVGCSHEMLVLARSIGQVPSAVVDPACRESNWLGLDVFLTDDSAIKSGSFDAAILAIDAPTARQQAYLRYSKANFQFPNLMFSLPGDGTSVGDALTVQRYAHLSVDCKLGRGVRMNIAAKLFHDTNVGDFVTLAPNAVVLASVTIGDRSYVGANATILPNISIGNDCVIGAGSVVTRDVANGSVVKGNPAC